uniref:EGF-like domain-containing protein n=1 Tax=Myotis lucifugus TaxID=59463 RepID=G1PLR7_MYOLU
PCTGANGCAHICQSENGVARCACHPGYQLSEDKKACRDINECAEGLAHCGHRCVNSVGSFTCACHPGSELGADGKRCYRIELEIVNSCEKNNGGCSHHCEHALGGPHCSCNHGHRLDSDEKTCIDLDECESGEACCAQLCINYLGGYECSCKEGFQISSDGCGCDDVDECLDTSIVCDQVCINSVGTYHCTCEEGYRIGSDGKTCIYDDELEEGEEELEVVRFAGLLFKSPPRLLHYVAPSLPPTYQDEEDEDKVGKDIRGELALLPKVVCLDHTFGHDCSLSCEDCMNGGRCQEGKRGCSCPAGWGGVLCNETCSPETSGEECGSTCDCQNGGTCDPLTGQCQCPPGVHGKTCEHGCPKGLFGKNCKRKCNCANNGHCHRVYGACVCEPGRYGRFCHLNCPKGAYGAGCSSECQCVEENTLECSAKNGSCTCKSGYQGNRCQKVCSPGQFGPQLLKRCPVCSPGVHTCTHSHTYTRNTFPTHLPGTILIQACPDGLWGPECQVSCGPCENGGQCNKKTGNCDCPPGYTGKDCTTLKVSGGLNCSQIDAFCEHLIVCGTSTSQCTCLSNCCSAFQSICILGFYITSCTILHYCGNSKEASPRMQKCEYSPRQGTGGSSGRGQTGHRGGAKTHPCAHCSLAAHSSFQGVFPFCKCPEGTFDPKCKLSSQNQYGDGCLQNCRCLHNTGPYNKSNSCSLNAGINSTSMRNRCPKQCSILKTSKATDCYAGSGPAVVEKVSLIPGSTMSVYCGAHCEENVSFHLICSFDMYCSKAASAKILEVYDNTHCPQWLKSLCPEVCPGTLWGLNCHHVFCCQGGGRCHICTCVYGSCQYPKFFFSSIVDPPCLNSYNVTRCQADLSCQCSDGQGISYREPVFCFCPIFWWDAKCLLWQSNTLFCSAYLACQRHCAVVDGLEVCNCHSGETGILGPHNVPSSPRPLLIACCPALSCSSPSPLACCSALACSSLPPAVSPLKCPVCPPGTYGKDCKQVCQCSAEKEDCHPVTGRCTCLPGYHGNHCHLECPKGTYGPYCQRTCKCLNGGNCDTMIGTCDCPPGFIGADCSQTCPADHYGKDCVQRCSCGPGQCDPVTGECHCSPGHMGAKCQQGCPQTRYGPNCELICTCKNGGLCNPVDGSCTCGLGWTGNYCEKKCSPGYYGPGCHFNCTCQNSGVCNRFSGSCECLQGYYGRDCEHACLPGFYGLNCAHICDCRNGASCDAMSGQCICPAGFHGSQCEKECSPGMFGDNCQHLCDCESNISCHPVTGKCLCPPGRAGARCEAECRPGQYGPNCALTCQCVHRAQCNPLNGNCTCPSKRMGPTCEE